MCGARSISPFPFEDIRKTIFSGQYERVSSYFHGLELASSGLPEGQELAILESVRDKIPAKVFSEPNANPVGDTPEAVRNNLREADRLLREAGWELKDRQRVNAKGETLTIELLGDSPNDERIFLPYKASLDRLGIVTTVRIVDDVQHVNRTRSFDFDIVSGIWGQSLSPGNEQREFWGSQAANREGSRNLAGISDPGVDALIDRVIFAKDRAELVAATKALDRVLLAHDYMVPQWTYGMQRTARWNRFSHPENTAALRRFRLSDNLVVRSGQGRQDGSDHDEVSNTPTRACDAARPRASSALRAGRGYCWGALAARPTACRASAI